MTQTKTKNMDMELTAEKFFFDLPLYTPIEVTDDNLDTVAMILEYHDSIEGYNPFVRKETTYKSRFYIDEVATFFRMTQVEVRTLSLQCLRYGSTLDYWILYDSQRRTIQKIGQTPSVADLQIHQVQRFKKLLSDEKLREFTRAIGLAANGVGIGSFVYLRRIFEYLINRAKDEAIEKGVIKDDDYQKKRMDERILLLADFLPDFLVEHRTIYGILSKGIHELDEQTCLSHFDGLKLGIEVILEDQLAEKQKKEKRMEAKKKIQAIKDQIKD